MPEFEEVKVDVDAVLGDDPEARVLGGVVLGLVFKSACFFCGAGAVLGDDPEASFHFIHTLVSRQCLGTTPGAPFVPFCAPLINYSCKSARSGAASGEGDLAAMRKLNTKPPCQFMRAGGAGQRGPQEGQLGPAPRHRRQAGPPGAENAGGRGAVCWMSDGCSVFSHLLKQPQLRL